MATWAEFEAQAPDVAAVAAKLWPGPLALQRGERPTRAMIAPVVAASGVGGMTESASRDTPFEFDLEQVDVAWWLAIGQAGARAVRRQWRAGRYAS